MTIISAEEMNALDINCRYFGLLPLQLMENAGAALAREIAARSKGKRIAIVAGRGNNGGDAFVAARHLDGFDVTVYLLGRSKDIATEEAKRNWQILERLDYDLRMIADSVDLSLEKSDLIVDAIFGTGVRGTIKGLEAQAIDAINSSGKPVISVDVPSGQGTNKVVRSDVSVTFHKPKPNMSGNVIVADIGIPPAAEFFVGEGDLWLMGRRSLESHKGDSGRILVIGGGPYTGAPALSAMAALRAGADIVTVAAPKAAARTISGYSPNLIVQQLSADHLCPADIPVLKEQIARHDVVVMGMGLGRHAETTESLAEIMPLCKKTVIDADALQPELPLKGIVTPHAGEFKRISGIALVDLDYRERAKPLKEFARQKGLVVLLKGKVDLISDGEVVRANTTGNPGMTVGGTGDVLAGITAAFYARASALRAASAAAFVNGRAGDLVYPEKDFGMAATDVIEKIPEAMRL
ncbi:MAG: NAD(P)H-hydrate dehydratase [Methanothrix sp.]|nr:NAD(P)H-hydrate dehydratase [Methanothrix sp.]MDD4446437.1 NAD(P)H-hydrate dehydratase [Methanothrix sp.]